MWIYKNCVRALALALLIFFHAPAMAATAQLALDLNRVGPGTSSDPKNLTAVGSTLFFTSDDGIHGRELWMSSGTPQSTRLALDLQPGPRGSDPRSLTSAGNALYFSATRRGQLKLFKLTVPQVQLQMIAGFPNAERIPSIASTGSVVYFSLCEPLHGCELWSADETTGGARMVRDIKFGPESSFPEELTLFNGRLYFTAWDNDHGKEIWSSDGTESGTKLLQDIEPGPDGSLPFELTPFAGYLFFTASNQSRYGWELWRTNGTPEGTSPYDIRPGPESSLALFLTVLNNRLAFFARSNGGAEQLWFVNAAMQLTMLPGTYPNPSRPKTAGNLLYFESQEHLWATDLTAQGTRMAYNPGYPGPDYLAILGAFQDKLIFLADSVVKVTSGSQGSTATLDNLDTSFELNESASTTDHVYFSGGDFQLRYDLYSTDATPRGTMLLGKTRIDNGSSDPESLTPYSGLLYFHGTDGKRTGIWRTNGRRSAQLVFEIGRIEGLLNAGGTLYFDDWNALYKLQNGHPVERMTPAALHSAQYARAVGSRVFFFGESHELWITAGTTASTHRVKDVAPGSENAYAYPVSVIRPLLYFVVNDYPAQTLWRSEGTAAGTYPLLASRSGETLAHFFAANGKLYFMRTADNYSEIWTSDGTVSGTVKLGDFQAVRDAEMVFPNIYMTLRDLSKGQQLWRFSVASRTAVLVTDIPNAQPYGGGYMFSFGKYLLFESDGSLWRTNGTPAGTIPLRKMDYQACGRRIGDAFYMSAFSPVTGSEIWVTNATPEGTKQVTDLYHGPYSSNPCGFTAFNNAIYFSAQTAGSGRELWRIPPER